MQNKIADNKKTSPEFYNVRPIAFINLKISTAFYDTSICHPFRRSKYSAILLTGSICSARSFPAHSNCAWLFGVPCEIDTRQSLLYSIWFCNNQDTLSWM
jgi:hypothetical protein